MKLRPRQIVLSLEEEGGQRGSYAFVCDHGCGSVEKPADAEIIRTLRRGGVTIAGPSIYPEMVKDPSAPPLTLDDLIDFHAELDRL